MSAKFELRDRRNGFLWIANSVFDEYAKRLQPSSLMVYLALARMANNNSQKCYPTYEQIAEMTGLSRRTVAVALQELREMKLIDWEVERRNNVYSLLGTTSAENALVQSGASTSAVFDKNQCSGLHPNKTNNKTQEQDSIFSLSNQSELEVIPPKKTKGKKTDERHLPFRQKLEKYWAWLNPGDGAYQWGAADAGTLGKFLKSWPALTAEQFREWLVNRSDSESFIRAQAPYQFLPGLNIYKDGPLNKYGKPIEESSGAA